MNVKELIDKLREFPDDMLVLATCNDDNGGYQEIGFEQCKIVSEMVRHKTDWFDYEELEYYEYYQGRNYDEKCTIIEAIVL